MLHIPWVAEDEWQARTDPELPDLDDPVWRLANLYEIQEATDEAESGVVFWPFVPKPEQRVLIWDIHVRKVRNLIVPKARKLGCSTCFMLVAFDLALWNAGFDALLVDKTLIDAREKMQKMVRVAWDKLPPEVAAMFNAALAEEKFIFHRNGLKDDAASQVRISVSGRGGTPNFLLVSEWGAIQFDQPKRSEEIKTGAMVAAEFGIRVIETTWKGPDDGDVWPYVAQALKTPEAQKAPKDWRLRFFPWWLEPKYSYQGDAETITPATWTYLRGMEQEITADLGHPFTFTNGQALFYQAQADSLGVFVKGEFPTVLRECWEAPVKGAIYAEAYAQALADGRVRKGIYDPALEVSTSWDLGGPENMVVWYFQIAAGRVRWIDCDIKLRLTTRGRVTHMQAKGYRFAKHFIPHDAANTGYGGLSYEDDLLACGLENVVVVERTPDEWLGINATRQRFEHFEFDAERTATAVKSVKAFHVHEKTKEPVHDWSSHACDALRTMAEAEHHGLVNLDAVGMKYDHLRFFDLPALEWFRDRAVSWISRLNTGVIENDGWVKKAPEQSWLRVWEEPCPGQAYLIALVPGPGPEPVLGVWRRGPAGKAGESGNVPILCATFMPGLRVDLDQLSHWTSAISRRWGRCLVIPAIDDASGLVAMLQADRAGPVWLREEVQERQSQGRARPSRKPGFAMTDQSLTQILATLRARVREKGMEIGAPEFEAEARHFIEPSAGGLPQAAPGHGENWVRMCALAAHCIDRATTLIPEESPPMQPAGHHPRETRAETARWEMSES